MPFLGKGGGGWIPDVLDSSFSLFRLTPHPQPRLPQGYMRNQCRTKPSLRLKGGLYPSWDGKQGWEMLRQPLQAGGQNATDRTMIGRRKESQVKRPRGHKDPVGREQPPRGEMLGEPQLHSGPETQAGGCKVWQFGLQVLVSIHHPGPLSVSLVPQPHRTRRPLFQLPLSAPGATLKRPVIWALWSLKLGEVGWRRGEVGAPVPRLVGAGRGLRTGVKIMGGDYYCPVKERSC